MGCAFLFINNSEDVWFFSLSLFLTNTVCFFHATRCAFLVRSYKKFNVHHPQSTAVWFITLALLIGLPGLGIGSSLWPIFYHFIDVGVINNADSIFSFWLIISIGWIMSLILLSFSLVLSVRDIAEERKRTNLLSLSNRLPRLRYVMFEALFVALLAWIIPLATLYTKALGV